MGHDASNFTVWIDDNFHFADESERVILGTFPSCNAAVHACIDILEEFLATATSEAPKSAEKIVSEWFGFGEDPCIQPEPEESRFRSSEYIRQRAREMGASEAS